jgi:type IV pilus assembly protein PilA
MFKTIYKMKARDEKGFTLVELLIVIAIIAILAAIAIPQFASYRARGIEASMVSDAKNIATTMEAVFADCQAYPTLASKKGPASVQLSAPSDCTADMPYVSISTGNTASATGGTTFTVKIENPNARSDKTIHTLDNTGATSWSGSSSSSSSSSSSQ